ncbi:MAG: rhamnulokinase, partial [Clostridia bacterium]|nr:rhamnulokinase [Clostridia bacterium]
MKYLAIDLGSSSARIMLAEKNSADINLTEIARFPHSASLDNKGHYRWDIDSLFGNIKEQVQKAIEDYKIESIGICSWGVDYGVIGEDGRLLDMPYCYRDSRGEVAFKKLHEIISEEDLYATSGIYPNPINTIYQLYADKEEKRYNGKKVKIAMIADLLAYYLTGNICIERSNASTTGLLNIKGDDWNFDLINKLGIDKKIFPKIIVDGDKYGEFCGVPVVAVGTHDTASAIYALDGLDNKSAFLASGSWLLFGKVLDSPICNKIAFDNRYTNAFSYPHL